MDIVYEREEEVEVNGKKYKVLYQFKKLPKEEEELRTKLMRRDESYSERWN